MYFKNLFYYLVLLLIIFSCSKSDLEGSGLFTGNNDGDNLELTGSPDTSFGSNGLLEISETETVIHYDAYHASNRVYFAGTKVISGDNYGEVQCLDVSSSSLCSSFGTSGEYVLPFAGELSGDESLTLKVIKEINGNIFVSGVTRNTSGYDDNYVLASITTSGALNTSVLGGDGLSATQTFPGGLVPDIEITDVGYYGGQYILSGHHHSGSAQDVLNPTRVEINSDGTWNITRHHDYSDDSETVSESFLLSDGSVILVGTDEDGGTSEKYFAAWKIRADGEKDTTFGTSGRFIYDNDSTGNIAQAGLIDEDGGHIYIAGALRSANEDASILRINLDGTLDTSFGTNGVLTFTDGFAGSSGTERILDIEKSGSNIYLCGYGRRTGSGNNQAFISKINTNGVLDTTFGTNGFFLVSDAFPATFTNNSVSRVCTLTSDSLIMKLTQTSSFNHYYVKIQ